MYTYKYVALTSLMLRCELLHATPEAWSRDVGLGRWLRLWHQHLLHLWPLRKLHESHHPPEVRDPGGDVWLEQELGAGGPAGLCGHVLPADPLPACLHWPGLQAGCQEQYDTEVR